MGIVNSSYSSKETISETIEIAPIPPNLFTDISVGKNDLSTEINVRVDDAQNKAVSNGFV